MILLDVIMRTVTDQTLEFSDIWEIWHLFLFHFLPVLVTCHFLALSDHTTETNQWEHVLPMRHQPPYLFKLLLMIHHRADAHTRREALTALFSINELTLLVSVSLIGMGVMSSRTPAHGWLWHWLVSKVRCPEDIVKVFLLCHSEAHFKWFINYLQASDFWIKAKICME